MNKEKQCAMIAEACGWKNIHFRGVSWNLYGIPPSLIDGCGYNPFDEHWPIPRYTADLNAMNEAEKTLTHEQYRVFKDHLIDVHVRDYEVDRWGFTIRHERVYSATAAERAEAFLRTLDKWE